MQLLTAQNGARTDLAENDFFSQNEQESRTFYNELDQQLSIRTLSPELLEANRIIAYRDKRIEELEGLLNENHTSTGGQLLLRKTMAKDIYDFISSAAEETIPDFILEHDGKEVIAVHHISGTKN